MHDEMDFSAFLSDEPPKTDQRVEVALGQAVESGVILHPIVVEFFKDEQLSGALAETLAPEELADYLANTSAFWNAWKPENASIILRDWITIPESTNRLGGIRRSESGQEVSLEGIRSLGLDPKKILMFRVTSPGGPKPEYYWTSDYFETKRGLTQEIDPTTRSEAVILVSNLEAINQNKGLIVDINDDSGLPVRQVGLENFDQNTALTVIPANFGTVG